MTTEEYERIKKRKVDGLVDCDYDECQAKAQPQSLLEHKTALEHWESHSYLGGCSHGL